MYLQCEDKKKLPEIKKLAEIKKDAGAKKVSSRTGLFVNILNQNCIASPDTVLDNGKRRYPEVFNVMEVIGRQTQRMRNAAAIAILILICRATALAALWEVRGQLSGWVTANGDSLSESQIGLRYIPGFSFDVPVFDEWAIGTELSVNVYGWGQLC